MTLGLGIGLGITVGGNGSGGGAPAALQTLTLSSTTFTQGTNAGTVVGTIGNKTSGSVIEIRSASGRVVPDATYANLVVGLTAANVGTFGITLREIHPTLGTKDTAFTITVSALTALSPMSASSAPGWIFGMSKINPSYAGNWGQVRDSTNTLRTIGFNGDGTMNTTGMSGFGDGVTFTVATWNDQSGNARNATSAARPPLFFPGNFATLINTPSIGSGGTGYTVGDVLTATGGIIADSAGQTAQLTVATVSGGVITGVTVTRAGKYKHSPSPTNNATGVTGGTGTGATFIWALTGDAGNVYNTIPSIDFTAAALNIATTDTSLNVGGTVNLAVFTVMARYGYGGAYTTRPGSPSTSSNTVVLGYGTTSSGVLLGGAPLAASNSGSQMDPVSFSKTKDSLGRSSAVYGQPEWMAVDESAPAVGAAFTNVWFNQTGATVTAGGDTRKHWSNRIHGLTAANSQRLVIGASGALGSAANAAIKEVIIYQPVTALTDTEAHRIAIDQNTRHSASTTTFAPRFKAIWTGQSYAVSQLSDSASGNGSANTAAAERRWKAKLAGYLGINSERISYGYPSRTCVGGTAILKRPMPGDPDRLTYWWDEDTGNFGNLATGLLLGNAPAITNPGSGYTVGDVLTWTGGTLSPGGVAAQSIVTSVSGGAITGMDVKTVGNYTVAPTSPNAATGGTGTGATLTATFAGGLIPYLDAVMFSIMYSHLIIIHSQGQEDSASVMTDDRINNGWSVQSYTFTNAVRTYIGQPNAPILSEILSRYDGNAAQNARVNTMTRRQYAYYPTQKNMFVAADSGHLARAVAAVFGAHLGSMTDFDSTTGTAEDGYQRSSWQDAKASANALRMVYGLDVVANDDWRGPILSAAVQSGSNTIDVTVSYPYGCVGTDISTVSGTYGGFRAFTSGGDLTISSVSKVNSTTMRVTLSASVPAGTSIVYEPNYASGLQGVSVRNQLMDNNPDLNLPVSSSQILAVT